MLLVFLLICACVFNWVAENHYIHLMFSFLLIYIYIYIYNNAKYIDYFIYTSIFIICNNKRQVRPVRSRVFFTYYN